MHQDDPGVRVLWTSCDMTLNSLFYSNYLKIGDLLLARKYFSIIQKMISPTLSSAGYLLTIIEAIRARLAQFVKYASAGLPGVSLSSSSTRTQNDLCGASLMSTLSWWGLDGPVVSMWSVLGQSPHPPLQGCAER